MTAWQGRGDPGGGALAVLKQALETRRAQVSALEGRAGELEAKLSNLPTLQGNLEVLRAAILVVETIASGSYTRCPICEGGVNLEVMASRANAGKSRIAQMEERAGQRLELVKSHEETVAQLIMTRREAERLGTEVARAEKAARLDEDPPAMTLEEARTKLRELTDAKAGWDAVRRSEERALAAERDSVEWSQLAEALSGALAILVERARKGFVERVQHFLPRTDLFGVELLDGEREILRVGLMRLSGDHMVLHAALSGAEWARVTAALALAVAPARGACIVSPEERAFDPDTLSAVLDAFDEVAADIHSEGGPQVIVTSPNAPRTVPSGWTVIDLGAGEGQVETGKSSAKRLPPANEPQRAANEVMGNGKDGKPIDFSSIFD